MKVLRGGGHNIGVITELTMDYRTIPRHNWNFMIWLNFRPSAE